MRRVFIARSSYFPYELELLTRLKLLHSEICNNLARNSHSLFFFLFSSISSVAFRFSDYNFDGCCKWNDLVRTIEHQRNDWSVERRGALGNACLKMVALIKPPFAFQWQSFTNDFCKGLHACLLLNNITLPM